MSMPSFYNTEECGELFAEKIPTKLFIPTFYAVIFIIVAALLGKYVVRSL